ncbi:MAG: hypothetical protein AAFQ90_05135 [Pseudomonadota bacterium]
MFAKTSRLVLTAALTSLAFAPIAASAKTRAADSSAVYTASAPGKGREAEGEKLVAPSILLAILAAAAAAGVIVIIDDGDDGQSPGAN